MLNWRWLIIDEISVVSAELLADVDCKLRALSRGNSPFKNNKHGQQRPVGGLNVLFIWIPSNCHHLAEASLEIFLVKIFKTHANTCLHQL